VVRAFSRREVGDEGGSKSEQDAVGRRVRMAKKMFMAAWRKRALVEKNVKN